MTLRLHVDPWNLSECDDQNATIRTAIHLDMAAVVAVSTWIATGAAASRANGVIAPPRQASY
jgi:hypothetical protein